MTSIEVALPIRRAQELLAAAVQRVDDALDQVAERIVRDVIGLSVRDDAGVPASPPTRAEPVATAGRSEYDDMITEFPLALGYHRDTNWAVPEMWLEMTAGGIGAGTFVASALTGSVPGMLIGYGLTVGVKGALLLLDLGRPERVWRVFAKPRTSWIARGSWAFAAFMLAGAVPVVAGLGGMSLAASAPLTALALVASLVLLVYDGFFLNASAGVEGWRSSVLPFFFGANALATGAALTSALLVNPPAALLQATAAAFLLAGALGYAYLAGVRGGPKSARVSEYELTQGGQSVDFKVGAGVVGLAIPGAIAGLVAAGVLPAALGALAAALGGVGVLYSRKAILQAGVHAPTM